MHSFALIQNFSFAEIAIIGFIIMLLFGAKRLPQLSSSVGKSIGEFKKGLREDATDPESVD